MSICLGVALLGDVAAAEAPVTAPAPVAAHEAGGGYIDRRAALIETLAMASDEGTRAGLLLDLAALSADHALGPEALSFLSGLPGTGKAGLAPALAARRDRIALAAWGLSGDETPPEPLRALIEGRGDTASGWVEAPLWRALAQARAGDVERAAEHLPHLDAALDAMAPALAAALLPELLEAAIEAGLWDAAHGLAQRFDRHPELRGGSAYRFLLGRAAQSGGNPVMAFDSYAMAAGGGDVWAQRARLALIDLGRATGTLPPEDAAVLLRQSWRLWRGDALEVATLERLAEVEYGRGEIEAAITALTEVQRRHPRSDAARQSGDRLDQMIADLYAQGASGALPIAEFVAAHRHLSPELTFRPGFAAQAERLAGRLLEIGATDAAAREYAAIRDQLAVMHDLELEEVPPGRIDALRLAQAEALLRGGQVAAAARALGTAPASVPELRDRLALLQARLSSATGDGDGVIATRMEIPSEGYLRLRAEALFDRGEWGAARDAYVSLWRDLGPDLGTAGTIRLLLAAHRANDAALVAELLDRLPMLAGSPELAEVARSLAPVAPLSLPIGQKSATDRMQGADAALRRLETVTGDG